jgi:hypothetical protein
MKLNVKVLSLIGLLSIPYILEAQPRMITACPAAVAATYDTQHKATVSILLIEASYQDIAKGNPDPSAAAILSLGYSLFRAQHPGDLNQLANTLPNDVKIRMLNDIKQYYPNALKQ